MATRGERLTGLLYFVLALILIASVASFVTWPQSTPAKPPPRAIETTNRIFLTKEQIRHAAVEDSSLGEVASLLKVSAPMRYGDFRWDDHKVPPGQVWIRVDLKRQTLSIFRRGHEIGTAVILYGTDGKPTPLGTFSVLGKSEKHYSRTYDAPMPNSLWLTNDGVAIHGSDIRWGAATHGCVGVPLKFAALLFGAATVGDRVTIIP